MTPYLVHKTWIDLDHVVLIESEAYYPYIKPGALARIQFAGVEQPQTIYLGEPGDDHHKTLDAFIAAWKARATK